MQKVLLFIAALDYVKDGDCASACKWLAILCTYTRADFILINQMFKENTQFAIYGKLNIVQIYIFFHLIIHK